MDSCAVRTAYRSFTVHLAGRLNVGHNKVICIIILCLANYKDDIERVDYMCTAVFKNQFLFRTVDRIGSIKEHCIIGRKNYIGGVIQNNYGEIWIDGINKHGLMTALLNYRKEIANECDGSKNRIKLHWGKFVLYLLENCRDVKDASNAIMSLHFSSDGPEMYPHFIITDKIGRCIVFESGKVYENTYGVLTNAPSFTEQVEKLKMCTSDRNDFYSSESRFSRIAQLSKRVKIQSIGDCFDLLTAVTLPEGADDRPGYRTILRSVMSSDSMTYSYAVGGSGKIKTQEFNGNFHIAVNQDEN